MKIQKTVLIVILFISFLGRAQSKKEKPEQELRDFKKEEFVEHKSNLNIPLNHTRYAFFERDYLAGENVHSAVKPYVYKDVNKHHDFDKEKSQFLKDKKSWGGKKLWNEHLVEVKADDYWFSADILLDVELGKDNTDNLKYTFNNSRILQVQGELGKNFSYSATIFESQGRFAGYVNDYIEIQERLTSFSAGVVPGRGKAKDFKEDAYDYPVSEGYIAYRPAKFFNFQMGQGKNFIGDGYRSMMVSDVAAPYPYFKVTTSFWKIQYTNLWTWMTDIRREAVVDGAHPRKYVSTHHLSINITEKLNIGLFEAVMTTPSRTGALEMDFLNPIIFYKSLEFARGEGAGSSVIGMNASYKFSKNFFMYSQLVFDEFTLAEIRANNGYWANKYGLQLGAKYFDAFKVKNLYLQGEFNWLRPYTFSHDDPILNYGHYGQQVAHAWGANFWETIAIARYQKERWSTNLKLIYGEKGFDYTDTNYGGDIFKSYGTREQDYGNEVGQGATASIFHTDFQVSYLINPRTNMRLFTGVLYRSFKPENPSSTFQENTTTWFNLGIKADLVNWYLDF